MSETDTPRVVGTRDGQSAVVSQPLPVIQVHRPTAERGAEDARTVLDGARCVFCNVPVREDEQRILTDKCGTYVVRPICKGHSEHPESWHRATRFDPERVRYCNTCGDLATGTLDDECFDCRTTREQPNGGRP